MSLISYDNNSLLFVQKSFHTNPSEKRKAEKMASTNQTATKKTPRKANLLDYHSIKNLLDESVTEIVTSKGYPEDVRLSNIRLLIGTIIIAIALVAQFYKKDFPANRDFLIGCIVLYILFNGKLQLIIHTKENNEILFTFPPEGSFSSTGLIVTSKLPRFSDKYTLVVESADPKSISAIRRCERLTLIEMRRGKGRRKKSWGDVFRQDMVPLQLTEDMTLYWSARIRVES